jgi:hypothetical protein
VSDERGHGVGIETQGEADEPGRPGPGEAHSTGRTRLCAWNPCRADAWRANSHETTDHESESAPVEDSTFKIGALGAG